MKGGDEKRNAGNLLENDAVRLTYIILMSSHFFEDVLTSEQLPRHLLQRTSMSAARPSRRTCRSIPRWRYGTPPSRLASRGYTALTAAMQDYFDKNLTPRQLLGTRVRKVARGEGRRIRAMEQDSLELPGEWARFFLFYFHRRPTPFNTVLRTWRVRVFFVTAGVAYLQQISWVQPYDRRVAC